MTQITLSPAQVEQLHGGPALVECRSPDGKVVGYLHVSADCSRFQVPDFTSEQLNTYERESGGRGLAEILTDLRKRR